MSEDLASGNFPFSFCFRRRQSSSSCRDNLNFLLSTSPHPRPPSERSPGFQESMVMIRCFQNRCLVGEGEGGTTVRVITFCPDTKYNQKIPWMLFLQLFLSSQLPARFFHLR
ncbi:hypothetical protein CEXT_227451 [Caerostris extrusa]|uniref:Uncharacterized protein n=1 Tax=Caerostris extrusa TaxID=172846 RepID=A0AAV4WNF8_CAEEX|nr:hypothetical protein CEXT_227451 [Caerostris extrusa]